MVSWKSKDELNEIFAQQFERFKQIESVLDEMFKYKWFLTYNVSKKEAGSNIEGLIEKHNSHCLRLSRHIRDHFVPLPVMPVNGERTHLHAKAWTNAVIDPKLMKRLWTHDKKSKFVPWQDGLNGDVYIYGKHQIIDDVRPYCGCNRQPCKSKKGNNCVYRDILKSL